MLLSPKPLGRGRRLSPEGGELGGGVWPLGGVADNAAAAGANVSNVSVVATAVSGFGEIVRVVLQSLEGLGFWFGFRFRFVWSLLS